MQYILYLFCHFYHYFYWPFTSRLLKMHHQNSKPTRNNTFLEYPLIYSRTTISYYITHKLHSVCDGVLSFVLYCIFGIFLKMLSEDAELSSTNLKRMTGKNTKLKLQNLLCKRWPDVEPTFDHMWVRRWWSQHRSTTLCPRGPNVSTLNLSVCCIGRSII